MARTRENIFTGSRPCAFICVVQKTNFSFQLLPCSFKTFHFHVLESSNREVCLCLISTASKDLNVVNNERIY